MTRLRSFVAPWAEIAYLRNELHGARASGSAEAKRGNRLATRIGVLDRALVKRREQAAHDQAYIDALERRLTHDSIRAARDELMAREQRRTDLSQQRYVGHESVGRARVALSPGEAKP